MRIVSRIIPTIPATLFLLGLPVTIQAQFTFVTNNGALTITGYSGSATMLVIPSTTNGYPITGIGPSAFFRRSTLTNVLLPDSIVTIGDSAFVSCFGLATINFPPNLGSIGGYAFDGCKLTTAALPQSVTNIGKQSNEGGENAAGLRAINCIHTFSHLLDGVF